MRRTPFGGSGDTHYDFWDRFVRAHLESLSLPDITAPAQSWPVLAGVSQPTQATVNGARACSSQFS